MKKGSLIVSLLFITVIARNADTNGTGWQNSEGTEIVLRDTLVKKPVWMTKNLDTDKYRNGDPIPKVTSTKVWESLTTGAYCYFKNDSATYAAYGKLYNWYAVNDPRGLAPAGWHVASDTEWTAMVKALGGDLVAGGAMKEAGTVHWLPPNSEATNTSGFTALAGGYRNDLGVFYDAGRFGFWWTATEVDTSNAWYRNMYHFDGEVKRNSYNKPSGFSVRCIRG